MTPRRRTALIAVAAAGSGLLVFLLVAALLLRAVGFLSGGERSGQIITVEDDRVAFTLELPGEGGLTTVSSAADDRRCRAVGYRTDADLSIEAYARDCRFDRGTNSQIGNGDHGSYRRLDDVPEAIGATEVDTGLGPATVFTQDYYECTNFCDEWREPVAIVTVEDPVDPDFPTLVLRSDKAELELSEFTEIVRSLAPPD